MESQEVFSKHTCTEQREAGPSVRNHLAGRLARGAVLGEWHRRGGGWKRRTEPPGRLGCSGASTYLSSPSARRFDSSFPSAFPIFPLSHPKIRGNPALQPFILPRHLASPQISRVCELGGRGVWAHWLHGVHGGEWASPGRRRRGLLGRGTAGLTAPLPRAGVLLQAAGAHRGLHQRGHLGVWYAGRLGCWGEEGNERAAALRQCFLDPPTANTTLRAQGTPPVQSVIFSAAKQVEGGGAGGAGAG